MSHCSFSMFGAVVARPVDLGEWFRVNLETKDGDTISFTAESLEHAQRIAAAINGDDLMAGLQAAPVSAPLRQVAA